MNIHITIKNVVMLQKKKLQNRERPEIRKSLENIDKYEVMSIQGSTVNSAKSKVQDWIN